MGFMISPALNDISLVTSFCFFHPKSIPVFLPSISLQTLHTSHK